MLTSDTTEIVQKIYDKKIRELSEEERFFKGLSLTHFCREMCLEGLKQRYPQANHRQLKKFLFELLYPTNFYPE